MEAPAGLAVSFQIASGSGAELLLTVGVESGMNVLSVFVRLEPGAATYPLVEYGGFSVVGGDAAAFSTYPLAGMLVVASFTSNNCQQTASDEGMNDVVACDVALDATLTMSGSNTEGTNASAAFSIHYQASAQAVACE